MAEWEGVDVQGAVAYQSGEAGEDGEVVLGEWCACSDVFGDGRRWGFFTNAKRQRLLLKNPFVPLFLRIAVMVFAAVALGMAAKIFVHAAAVNDDANPGNQCSGRASTYMAICVGSIAIPYLGYVTWDEYMSKPCVLSSLSLQGYHVDVFRSLGLRSASTKTLLLLCDLFFVIFASSNLSLAFDALFDHRWACYDEQYEIIKGSGNSTSTIYNVPATCPNNPSTYWPHLPSPLPCAQLLTTVCRYLQPSKSANRHPLRQPHRVAHDILPERHARGGETSTGLGTPAKPSRGISCLVWLGAVSLGEPGQVSKVSKVSKGACAGRKDALGAQGVLDGFCERCAENGVLHGAGLGTDGRA